MNMLFKIIGAALITCAAAVLLRQYKSEYALAVVVSAAVLIYGVLLGHFKLIADFLAELANSIENGGVYLSILLKCFAAALISEVAADICRDSGESALASKIQIAGKLTVAMLALPLFKEVFELAVR